MRKPKFKFKLRCIFSRAFLGPVLAWSLIICTAALVSLTLTSKFAVAAYGIKLVAVKEREAAKILLSVQQHLPAGAKASSQGQQIILSGQPEDLAQLEALIQALDVPLPVWRVLFAQGHINLQAAQASRARSYSTARVDIYELLVAEGANAKMERGFWYPVQTKRYGSTVHGFEWLAGGILLSVASLGENLHVSFSSQQAEPVNRQLGEAKVAGRKLVGDLNLQPGQWVTLGSEAHLAQLIPDASRRYSGGSTNNFFSLCIEEASAATCPR